MKLNPTNNINFSAFTTKAACVARANAKKYNKTTQEIDNLIKEQANNTNYHIDYCPDGFYVASAKVNMGEMDDGDSIRQVSLERKYYEDFKTPQAAASFCDGAESITTNFDDEITNTKKIFNYTI